MKDVNWNVIDVVYVETCGKGALLYIILRIWWSSSVWETDYQKFISLIISSVGALVLELQLYGLMHD